jgi:hypothetical protein
MFSFFLSISARWWLFARPSWSNHARRSLWALNILAEEGFVFDSSHLPDSASTSTGSWGAKADTL